MGRKARLVKQCILAIFLIYLIAYLTTLFPPSSSVISRLKAGAGQRISDETMAKRPVVNPHPFHYVRNNPDLCRGRDVYIIAYVHTSPENHDRRTLIRRTWGNPENFDDAATLLVIFVMGISSPADYVTEAALENEQRLHADIIQEDFVDTYRNLTYKGIAALKWISQYCAHAHYVLKADDDMFINTFNLLRHLMTYDERRSGKTVAIGGLAGKVSIPVSKGKKATAGVLVCYLGTTPVLRGNNPWAVTKDEWPNEVYPPFCSGSAFFMTTGVAVALHRVSYSVPFFWIDDVYITGILVRQLGFDTVWTLEFHGAYALFDGKLEETFTYSSRRYDVVFGHVNMNKKPAHTSEIFWATWQKIMKINGL